MKFLIKNFTFLREKINKSQAQLSLALGFSRGVWNMYELGKSKPSLDDLKKISDYFGYTAGELLDTDLQNVHLIEKTVEDKKGQKVHPNVLPNVHPIGKKEPVSNDFTISIVAEDAPEYGGKVAHIPVTDISVAAGGGHYNESHIETSKAVHLPSMFVKPGHTYLCVKIKGESMAPTLQDGGYVIIRLLDRGEWAKMPDERVFVVIDKEGKAYLKRVKNRFKQGLIILRSDNPDKATYPSFNFEEPEIMAIWYVEWYFSAKMPNIHDQYYSRLQQLEDKVELMAVNLGKK